MPVSFDELPFDVLFFVTSFLDFDDIINIGHSCRQLQALLHESTLCRRAIETHMRYTKEAQLAQNHCRNTHLAQNLQQETHLNQEEQVSYIEAMRRIKEKRQALSSCQPFSAKVVGQGHGFCYRQGTLCILEGNIIRVLDASNPSRNIEIDLSTIIDVIPGPLTSTHDYSLSILNFSDDVAAIHFEKQSRPSNSCIYAISTRKALIDSSRVLGKVVLNSSYKLFVRHTAEWLYYGTYSAMSSSGRHEWEIRGVPLTNEPPKSEKWPRLVLEGFYGKDLSSTVAFEVRDGYFYAVSNQTSFEVEEIDWTSFYHCIRFPLDYPRREKMEINRKVYRRQHVEGPIHDSWTELTIQFEDATGDAKIVESRREWIGSSSRQLRSFYIADFDCNPTSPLDPNGAQDSYMALPENDLFTTVLGPDNKPNYAPVQQRFNPGVHPEITSERNTARTFILARTKLKAYNLSSETFLDLVEDDKCCSNPATGPCLRLRVGSRRVAPLDWMAPGQDYEPSKSPSAYLGQRGDVVYRHSPIKMWPPPASTCACSKRLHRILNPPLPNGAASYSRYVVGSVDENGLVYMIRPGRPSSPSDANALGVIVMVSFTRGPLSAAPPLVNAAVTGASTGQPFHAARTEEQVPDSSYWQWEPRVCKGGTCC